MRVMSLINLLFEQPLYFVIVAGSLIASITVHEFAHAYCSFKLGDPTAKLMGRLSLNPLRHLDPIGTVALLLFGFGWGKPVIYNEQMLMHPKRDAALIAFAGPLSNFLTVLILTVLVLIFGRGSMLGALFTIVIYFNLILGFFNLIPVHPLDGFKVVNGLLPENLSYQWIQMQQFGVFILLALILTGSTQKILGPLVDISMKLLHINF